jgi:hypothetical protein
MRSLRPVACYTLLLAVFLLTAGCEDSGVIAPSDSQIIMLANPTTIVIDDNGGDTSGVSTITAQLFDANGFPLQGLSVTFNTTEGTLASRPPSEAPILVETDANGLATDVLTLTVNDAYTVDVTASSGTLSGSVQVSKRHTSENTRPTAVITADPPTEQYLSGNVKFYGTDSSDPDGAITCYQWRIEADRDADTNGVSQETRLWQGPARLQVSETYFKLQQVSVTLWVSDDADAGSWCESCDDQSPDDCGDPESAFNGAPDSLLYDITCPTPTASVDDATKNATIGEPVTLDGSSSSSGYAGVAIADWTWDCGDGNDPVIPDPEGDPGVAVCTYNTVDIYTATLTVTNGCGESDVATVRITVTAQ